MEDARTRDYSAGELTEELAGRALPFWESCSTLEANMSLFESHPEWTFEDGHDRLAIARTLLARNALG